MADGFRCVTQVVDTEKLSNIKKTPLRKTQCDAMRCEKTKKKGADFAFRSASLANRGAATDTRHLCREIEWNRVNIMDAEKRAMRCDEMRNTNTDERVREIR